MLDCYRDASVLQHIAVSLTDTYQLFKTQQFSESFKKLVIKNNFLCLKAVAEQLRCAMYYKGLTLL